MGYTTDGVNYFLDGPAGNFSVLLIRPLDLKFNNIVEISNRYDQISAELKNPAGNEVITGPMAGAYEFFIFEIKEHPDLIALSPPNNTYRLIDNDPDNSIEANPVNEMIFDMKILAIIRSFIVYSGDSFNSWKILQIETSDTTTAPQDFTLAGFYTNKLMQDTVVLSNLLEESRTATYVKFITVARWSNNKTLRLNEITFNVERYKKRKDPADLAIQDKVNLVLPYNDIDDDGIPEDDNGIELAGVSEADLGVFVLNGNRWDYVGGEVDTANKVIYFDTQVFGIFGIFPVDRGKLFKSSVNPRYVTSDADGINDCLTFSINPERSVKLDILIYKLSGEQVNWLVRSVMIDKHFTAQWCGRDDDRSPLPIGPYLYEIRFDGKKEETGIILNVK